MTAKELAKKSSVPLWKVYYVASKIGKLPTVDELRNWKQEKRGRPPKRWKSEEN